MNDQDKCRSILGDLQDTIGMRSFEDTTLKNLWEDKIGNACAELAENFVGKENYDLLCKTFNVDEAGNDGLCLAMDLILRAFIHRNLGPNTQNCPHCGKKLYLEREKRNVENYGDNHFRIMCPHCNGALVVRVYRTTVVDCIRKGTHSPNDCDF